MSKKTTYRTRRISAVIALFTAIIGWLIINPTSYETEIIQTKDENQYLAPLGAANQTKQTNQTDQASQTDQPTALTILSKLEVKGRAPKTGYARTEFYNNWPTIDGCSLRQIIIKREVGDSAKLDSCNVIAGTFTEPYTGEQRNYTTKEEFSKHIQIDHIVALSDAWQKGAQYKTKDERYQLATDPLNLIAADSSANQQKSDGDAATWLPPNKSFRCQYVARQISVKYKYGLWLTQAEHDAIAKILETCPNEPAVGVDV